MPRAAPKAAPAPKQAAPRPKPPKDRSAKRAPTPAPPPRQPAPRPPRRAIASRRARSRAASPREKGVDLSALTGSARTAAIVKADVEGAKPGAAPAQAARRRRPPQRRRAGAAPPSPRPMPDIPHEATKLSNMRKTIARRLTESKQTGSAHLPDGGHPARRAAQAARRAQQEPREPRREAVGQRPADQGAGGQR